MTTAAADDFSARAATWDDDPIKVARAVAVADGIRRRVPLDAATRALEYGCGTGLVSFALRPPLERVTLADSAPGMLAVVEAKRAAAGANGFRALQLDLAVDPPPPERFDLIYNAMTLHHIADTAGILRQWSALLTRGGRLAIADLDAEDGTFHGSGFDGHRGFDREALARLAEVAGLRDIAFDTVFRMNRPASAGQTEFPVFLMIATKA